MRIRIILLVCCMLWGTAWGDDGSSDQSKKQEPKTDAQKYAAALNQFLMDVNKQVAAKIAAEQAFYKTTAAIYLNHYKDDALGNLALDRIEGADALAAKTIGASSLGASLILQDSMRAQAQLNVAAMRKMLISERDIQNSYLSSVTQLDAGRAKITALSNALKGLSVPNGTAANLKDLTDYAQQVKDAYVTDQCANIDPEVADLTVRQKAAQTKKDSITAKDLGTRMEALNQFKKSNCPASKAAGAKQ